MNKYSLTCIIILFLCALDIDLICKVTCVHDGEQLGIMVNNKCYCANERNLTQIITRVPKNGKVYIEPKKTYSYE